MHFTVKNLLTGQYLSQDEIIDEVNRDRSDDWTDYTVEDLDENPDDVLQWIDPTYFAVDVGMF